jgi:hypothetical protein
LPLQQDAVREREAKHGRPIAASGTGANDDPSAPLEGHRAADGAVGRECAQRPPARRRISKHVAALRVHLLRLERERAAKAGVFALKAHIETAETTPTIRLTASCGRIDPDGRADEQPVERGRIFVHPHSSVRAVPAETRSPRRRAGLTRATGLSAAP